MFGRIIKKVGFERKPKEKDTRKLIVAAAERLFRQIGFQKTTVIDIAHELHMSPTNIYRFVAAKSEITEAVCVDLLGKIEAEARKIAVSRGTAMQRIRNLIGFVEAHTLNNICSTVSCTI